MTSPTKPVAWLTRRHTDAVHAAFTEQFEVVLNADDHAFSDAELIHALQHCDVLVPVVGDPLTFIAGVLRVPFVIFLPLVAIGKAARYAVLAFGFGS